MADLSILTVGCMSDHGGQIITGDPSMQIDGKPVARVGDLHSCPQFYPTVPPIPHAVTPIIRTAPVEVRGSVNMREFAYEGDTTGCGAVLLKCSTNAIGVGLFAFALLAVPFLFLNRNKSSSQAKKPNLQKESKQQSEVIQNKIEGLTNFINRNLNPPEVQKAVETKDSTCSCPTDKKD